MKFVPGQSITDMAKNDDIHPNAPAFQSGNGTFRSSAQLGANPEMDKWMSPGILGLEPPLKTKLFFNIPDTTAHYDVRRGDSLWSIAVQKLGDGRYAYDLARLNRISPEATLDSGERLIVPDYRRYDLTVTYMLSEMLTNAKSLEAKAISDAINRSKQAGKASKEAVEDIKKVKRYDDPFRLYGDQEIIKSMALQSGIRMTEANIRFFLQVRTNGPWDHKPILRRMYQAMPTPPRPFGSLNRWLHFPIRGNIFHEYYYDIWSNIHYGYVGTRCGFDEKTLQDSAGSGSPGAGDNDEGDVISVKIGIELWKNFGLNLTAVAIQKAILAHTSDYIAARKREIYSGKSSEKATNVVITDNDYK